MLDSPIWVLIINVVAMDMLKSKLPPSKSGFLGTVFPPSSSPISLIFRFHPEPRDSLTLIALTWPLIAIFRVIERLGAAHLSIELRTLVRKR